MLQYNNYSSFISVAKTPSPSSSSSSYNDSILLTAELVLSPNCSSPNVEENSSKESNQVIFGIRTFSALTLLKHVKELCLLQKTFLTYHPTVFLQHLPSQFDEEKRFINNLILTSNSYSFPRRSIRIPSKLCIIL